MTTRKGHRMGAGGTIEAEIERAREDSNWKRVIQLADQLKQKPEKQFETLGNFLIGEGKLEDFLEEYPPKDKNIGKAKDGLGEAKDLLMNTIGEDAKKLGVHLDSYILLGKLHYAQGNYSEALRYYERAQLDSLEEKQLPARSLKIMAEAFAIKALCFEKVAFTNRGSTSKAKVAEREANIIKCYEIAGDLTLLFLQVADKSTSSGVGQSTWSVTSAGTTSSSPIPPPMPSSNSSANKLGPILEMALLKAPALNLKTGNSMRAVERFRAMLQAEESESTKEIRRNVCWKLAEVLLHSVSEAQYVPPTTRSNDSPRRQITAKQVNCTDSPWKPKRHAGANLYTPKTKDEEIMLLLLLSENMARKEAILSQAPEFFGMRSNKFRDAIITYDLTTIALSRIRNFKILSDMLEQSMKFSFNEIHTWTQFGHALAIQGQTFRSLSVFRELAERNEADAGSCLAVSRMCYERLHLHKEGLEWARRALKKDMASPERSLRARGNVYMAIGCILKSRGAENHAERHSYHKEAEQYLLDALSSETHDHLVYFYLAYHYALIRSISKAIQHVKTALELYPDHQASLHLFILLLSARNDMAEALDVAEKALEEFPDSLPLMSLKVRLQEKVLGGEAAILTTKGMLEQWQLACDQILAEESTMSSDMNPSLMLPPLTMGGSHDQLNGGYAPLIGRNQQQPNSGGAGVGAMINSAGFDALSDKDSVSLHAHSITASHVEKTLSEVASSFSAPFPRPGPQDPSYTQMRIWLLCAELHLNEGNVFEAEQCLLEARYLAPLSYHLMFMKGRVLESRGELDVARQCYENSLGINPSHISSLQHLSKLYYHLGFYRLSEQSLKIAVRLEPNNEELWTLLGEVKESIAQEMLTLADSIVDPNTTKEESEIKSPGEAGSNTLFDEATRMFKRSAECQAIALSLQGTSPILPFTTVPLCFE